MRRKKQRIRLDFCSFVNHHDELESLSRTSFLIMYLLLRLISDKEICLENGTISLLHTLSEHTLIKFGDDRTYSEV